MNLYSPYFAHEIHRDWLEQFEREAELHRLLPKRASRRLHRPHFLGVGRRRHHARRGAHGAC